MRRDFRAFLQIFLIACFVLAQVSPACAFVSGQNKTLEICAADGSLKTIVVSSDYSPIKDHEDKNQTQKIDCGFCFAQSHLGKISVDNAPCFMPFSVRHDFIADAYFSKISSKYSPNQPRAPPFLS